MIDALASSDSALVPTFVSLLCGIANIVAFTVQHFAVHDIYVTTDTPIGVLLDMPSGYVNEQFAAARVQYSYLVVITWGACTERSDDLWALGPDVLVDGDIDAAIRIITTVQHGERRRYPAPQPSSLTGAERAVLRGVAYGQNNDDIAIALCLSEKTVRNHLTSIYSKLQLPNRQAALLYYWGWARRRHL